MENSDLLRYCHSLYCECLCSDVSQLLSDSYGQDWVMEGSLEVNIFAQRATLNVQGISLRMVSTDAEWHTNILSSWLTIILLNRSYSERDLFRFPWKINERASVVLRKAESGPQSTYCSPWQNQDSWTICRFLKKHRLQKQQELSIERILYHTSGWGHTSSDI